MILLILPALFGLAACQHVEDPSNRAGTWKPEHISDANLVLMVANPADLDRGHGDGSTFGATAAEAIERLRADKVKPLPSSGLAEIHTVSNGAGSGGGTQ